MQTTSFKAKLRHYASQAYYATGHFRKRLQGKVIILSYHRVISDKELATENFIQHGMYVHQEVFAQHLQFLQEHFTVLSCEALLNLWEHRHWDATQRYCVITFDDGWLDNYRYAYPLLRQYNLPAAIFLPTAMIGTTHWFWPDQLSYLCQHSGFRSLLQQPAFLHTLGQQYPWLQPFLKATSPGNLDALIEVCKDRPEAEIAQFIHTITATGACTLPPERLLLNWQEVEAMSRHGIAFGSHSCTHSILTKLPPDKSQEEIQESLRVLRSNLVNYVPVFCYPNGNFSPALAQQVASAGYRAALSTNYGFEGQQTERRFFLNRILIHNDISHTIPLFALRISCLF